MTVLFAVGRDGISSLVLKRYAEILTPTLTFLCNLSFETGIFPAEFKLAEIIPIHKNGCRDRVTNFRPISILTSFSKILERCINTRIITFLEKNCLLSNSQFGFRSQKSTSDAVLELTNFIVTNMDSKRKVLAVFLDLAKAFDTVSVPLLIGKLERLGLRGTPLNLLTDYLTNRYQRVRVDNFVSEDLLGDRGIPQGSILGSTLFLTYVNDLCDLQLKNGKIIAFADDTALLFSVNSWDKVYESAQSELNSVSLWLTKNEINAFLDLGKSQN